MIKKLLKADPMSFIGLGVAVPLLIAGISEQAWIGVFIWAAATIGLLIGIKQTYNKLK